MPDCATQPSPVRLAYIGCWYKNDMYSHNCSNLVDSLRTAGTQVDVVTSNCRCFSSAQKFAIAKDELINGNCSAIAIPHAPRYPGKKHGMLKYLAVKTFRLDLIFAMARGFLYYKRARRADVIHFDQVLEAFGCVPLFILIALATCFGKRVAVTVHEIDPFQREHKRLNRLYNSCTEVFVYSEEMKQQIVGLGAAAENIKVIRYGTTVPELVKADRKQYIYFGGHSILRNKGYAEMLDALVLLKRKGMRISLVIYVGHGCNGLADAKELAVRKQVADMITWQQFYSAEELATVYQRSKACIIPYTGGSARHPLTCAMVNATPVLATRAVDIPEYLGELGIYVDGSASSIAREICDIENGRRNLTLLGEGLRAKALAELDYRKIGQELSREYSRIAGKPQLLQIQPKTIETVLLQEASAPIFEINPLQDTRWKLFTEVHSEASAFHRVEWLQALKTCYGYEPVVFSSSPAHAPLTNGLVCCRVQSALTGSRLVSLPFSDHCQPLAGDPEEMDILLAHAADTVARNRWKYLEIRPTHHAPNPRRGFAISDSYYWHRLDIDRPDEFLFKSFHKNCVQRKIRRAERELLRYEAGCTETLLNHFYKLLIMTRRRQNIPPQPLKWFRTLMAVMGQSMRIHVALKGETPVASILTISDKKTLVYKYGCSDARFSNLGGTAMLFWNAIQEAKANGLEELDMGRSHPDNLGLVTYKEHWGAKRSTVHYWRYPAQAATSRPESAIKYAKHLISVAPDASLVMLGNLFYRHIG